MTIPELQLGISVIQFVLACLLCYLVFRKPRAPKQP